MCSVISHDTLKQDAGRFFAECRYVGLQADGEGGLLELWNHKPCNSTLAVAFHGQPAARELLDLAERYAAHCRTGEVLREDDRYYWPFAHLIPGALAKRGLHLEHVPGGWLVCLSPAR